MGTGSIPREGAPGEGGCTTAISKLVGWNTGSGVALARAKPALPPFRTGLFLGQPHGQAAEIFVCAASDSQAAMRSALAAKGGPAPRSSSTGPQGETAERV